MGKQLDSFSPENSGSHFGVLPTGDISGALIQNGDYQSLYYYLLVIIVFLLL